MRKLQLMARFPLGIYIGHKADGSLDLSPSPARLHAALLNSAAQGSLSESGQPSAASLDALTWLENHPPVALFQPESRLLGTSSSRFIYRGVGTLKKTKSGVLGTRIQERRVSDGVSINAPFGYEWNDVPEDIASTICTLAQDVSCLGETHSVVVLEEAEFTPNLFIDRKATAFTPGTQAREVPIPGRTQALVKAHSRLFKKKMTDSSSVLLEPNSPPPPRNFIKPVRYRTGPDSRETHTPWSNALFFKLSKSVPMDRAVELCSTMHKALIARNGNDVSPIITGKYLPGTLERPANRLAIQYIPVNWSRVLGFDYPVLVLFIPSGAAGIDLQQIREAENIRHLWSRSLGKIGICYTGENRFADDFWPQPEEGITRLWKPLVPIIPETRRVSKKRGQWHLSDSGLLSLGYVFRDNISPQGTGEAKYISIRNQVSALGATVSDAHTVPVRARNFVHRTHKSVPVQPYTATFSLGQLANERPAIMVGQSRHLGGGLLVPFDVEKEND